MNIQNILHKMYLKEKTKNPHAVTTGQDESKKPVISTQTEQVH